MPDLWFFAGLAMGIVIAGFSAVGAFDRGADSVRRTTWSRELVARQRTATASRTVARSVAPRATPSTPARARPTTERRIAGWGVTEPRAALSQRLPSD